ncbi:CBS domain-containing protein [Filimonas lacunae]|uniref:CBS domain-containing protein n=1 Tax=Filimonas lacunae TaxID=477680 RepID=A0A173MR78_9BACT|nr:CBS domain-containing protein [Filimonas lacunae]BAV09881.1 CBS domain-containing protein [Filimonas lacunae]SIS80429.1 CBS domain-containing protein [Filimonas lacunae]
MLTSQLIVTSYPAVNLFDKAGFALQLMEDYDIQHLPIVSDEKFRGLISKDDLLDADEAAPIALLEEQWIKASVHANDHFLQALKQASALDLSLIPVINEQSELQGVISRVELLHAAEKFTGAEEPGGLIVMEMEKRNFSFGEMSRLVETNDAYITQLNTYIDSSTGLLQITMKVNKSEISDIVATFQRYEYTVKHYFGEESYQNELKENYDLLMTYLKM